MTAITLSSPRLRRRLGWLLAFAGVIAAIALASVLMPSHSRTTAESAAPVDVPAAAAYAQAAATGQPARPYAEPPTVPVPRRAVNALLDRFIPAVIEREDLAGGWKLVTPEAR